MRFGLGSGVGHSEPRVYEVHGSSRKAPREFAWRVRAQREPPTLPVSGAQTPGAGPGCKIISAFRAMCAPKLRACAASAPLPLPFPVPDPATLSAGALC